MIDYRKRVMGAWLGKAVGGTLGAAWEGASGPLDLNFYRPIPATMLPNDDLDLQVVWACRLATDWNGVVSKENFSLAWQENIGFPYDEYGVAIRNLRRGIPPPYSGQYDNFFTDGLGAAIRSELWACLAPGDPSLAANYAYEDACVDHDGNGIYAEQFLSAMESLAFVETSIPEIVERALAVIPEDCRLACSVRDTVNWLQKNSDFHDVRRKILQVYGSYNFTDVCMCVPFMVAALILGKGDFSASICYAVNFGRDTDCTGATVGAFLGILNPDLISERWLMPIGRSLILSREITGVTPPETLDEFTDFIVDLKDKVCLQRKEVAPPDLARFAITCEASVSAPWFALDFRKFSPQPGADRQIISLPGNCITVDFLGLPPESLYIIEVKIVLMDNHEKARVMVNTTANMLCWMDGEYLFGREGGEMLPAFHRAPVNQLRIISLTAGEHVLRIGLAPMNESMRSAPLVFGVADEQNFWLI